MPDAMAFLEEGLAALARSIDERGELRVLQLATRGCDDHPGLRSVILRAFEREPPMVAEFHSDARAAKIADMLRDDRVAMLGWSSARQLQIRLAGAARAHRDDALASARWDRLSASARAPYGASAAPGTAIDDPTSRTYLPSRERFAQFVVIRVEILAVDVLRLGPHGDQRRARGLLTSAGLKAGWIGA